MKTWLTTFLACSLAMGCIEDNNSSTSDASVDTGVDTGIVEPEPTPPEPAPQPDAPEPDSPEPDSPEPDSPEPDSPEPDSPEPDSPQPDSPEPDSPEPDSPEPDSPEPDSPEPDSPQPDSPEPDSPEPDSPEPESPEPEAPPIDCPAACDRIEACFAEECAPLPQELRAQCHAFCDESPEQITDIVDGVQTCDELISLVVRVSPDAGELCEGRLTCDVVCDRLIRDCVGNPGNDNERAACIAGCTEANPGQPELQCAFVAECDQVDMCEDVGPPPGDVAAQCAQACVLAFECGVEGAPDIDREQFIAQCEPACIAESTPEQLECVLNGDGCEELQACFDEVEPPQPGNVEEECVQACGVVFDCGFGIPPGADRAAFIAGCTPECVAESTPQDRACINAADGCEAALMCVDEEG